MNKLWVYGCSFSEPFGLIPNKLPAIFNADKSRYFHGTDYWGTHLANKLNLECITKSCAGVSWNYINERIDEDIIIFIQTIYNDITNFKDIRDLIPKYFYEFVHNKVGALLLKSERDNINKLSRPNFNNNKGKLMVYQKRFEEYVWVIYLDEDNGKRKIIINDINEPIKYVFAGSLYGYPDTEIILPESKNNLKYDENNIYETYNLDNIN